MITQCALIDKCQNVNGKSINCEGRNFLQCGFFHNALSSYCEKIGFQCKLCKYPNYCGAEHKKRFGKR